MIITKVFKLIENNALEILFGIALVATLSSLVLSNVLDYPPCELCWYQRIFMFPLPFIYGAGLVIKDKRAVLYGLILVAVGAVVAIYHNLLQWGIISENVLECNYASVSCADPIINWLGFLTIPLGSFFMFSALAAVSWLTLKNSGLKINTDKAGANRMLVIAAILVLGTALFTVMVG